MTLMSVVLPQPEGPRMVTYSPLLASIGIASSAINVFVARVISAKRVNITRVQMRDQYHAGLVPVSDLLEAQTSASQAESGLLDSRIAYRTALQAYLDKAGE